MNGLTFITEMNIFKNSCPLLLEFGNYNFNIYTNLIIWKIKHSCVFYAVMVLFIIIIII